MKKKNLKDEKKIGQHFFFFFSKLPQKRCQGGWMPSTLSTPQSVYEEDLAEETAEKNLKNQKIKKKFLKNRTSFLFNFSKLPPKKDAQGNAVYILSASMCFWRGWSIRGCWKFILQMYYGVDFFFSIVCGRLLCQPISEYWNRTTILIPFLQAIKHFCNFIPSYFMKRFAFLIDDTSYTSGGTTVVPGGRL